jgi:hypothetical protein
MFSLLRRLMILSTLKELRGLYTSFWLSNKYFQLCFALKLQQHNHIRTTFKSMPFPAQLLWTSIFRSCIIFIVIRLQSNHQYSFITSTIWSYDSWPVVSFRSDDLQANRPLSIASSFAVHSWHIFFVLQSLSASWLAPFSCWPAVHLLLAILSKCDWNQWLAFIAYLRCGCSFAYHQKWLALASETSDNRWHFNQGNCRWLCVTPLWTCKV